MSHAVGHDDGSSKGIMYNWTSSHQQTFGGDPFEPDQTQTSILPYKTIAAAYAELVAGEPGWILLRSGEDWDEERNSEGGLTLKSGPQPTQQNPDPGWMLIGAYTDSTSGAGRPAFKRIRMHQQTTPLYSVAIVGVKITAALTEGIHLNRPG